MQLKTRLSIQNIWVDAVTRAQALTKVQGFLEQGTRPHSIFASNPEKNFSVPRDPELYASYKQADLLLPDGIGVVWAARLLYGAEVQRIPGAEFIFDICGLAATKGYKVFLYGAKEEVNARSAELLCARFPELQIAGRANGYVQEADMPALIEQINDSGAEILFVALGSPRQEKWFSLYQEALTHIRVVQGIGGTLDTIGGTVKRAPAFWCRHNLEWLYRLLCEPKRIKRQKVLPLFAFHVCKTWVKKKCGASPDQQDPSCAHQ